ncbi:hypothetical protein SM033_00022 [Vibrio phage vB_VpaM_sm033]|nr:hypothetical protein SM033_00022 [Vibrio phage vB_VpaM_sm033]
MAANPAREVAKRHFNETLNGVAMSERPEYSKSLPHLKWMLYMIIMGELSSETKENRWLGYVQCALDFHGLITVESERNATRDIFNGY